MYYTKIQMETCDFVNFETQYSCNDDVPFTPFPSNFHPMSCDDESSTNFRPGKMQYTSEKIE